MLPFSESRIVSLFHAILPSGVGEREAGAALMQLEFIEEPINFPENRRNGPKEEKIRSTHFDRVRQNPTVIDEMRQKMTKKVENLGKKQ